MRRFPSRIFLLMLALILSCTFACPSFAGESGSRITLCTDHSGNAGWVTVDHANGRMRATPYLRISGHTFHGVMNAVRRTGMVRVSTAERNPQRDPAARKERKEKNHKALSSLLAGPNGMSLGNVIDLARQTSDAARATVRKIREEQARSHATEIRLPHYGWRFATLPRRLAETESLFPQSNGIPSGTGVHYDTGQDVHFAVADFSYDE